MKTEMKVEHTPGPWKVTEWAKRTSNNRDEVLITSTAKPHIVSMLIYSPTDQANAQLIAAAPELLAALVDASQLIPVAPRMHPDDLYKLQTRVLAAIAKAQGVTP